MDTNKSRLHMLLFQTVNNNSHNKLSDNGPTASCNKAGVKYIYIYIHLNVISKEILYIIISDWQPFQIIKTMYVKFSGMCCWHKYLFRFIKKINKS